MHLWLNVSLFKKVFSEGNDCCLIATLLISLCTRCTPFSSILEVFYCWISLYLEGLCNSLVLSRIYFGKFHFPFHLSGGCVPFWLKCFAVAAPRSVEFHHPNIFGSVNSLFEVRVSQDNHIFVSGWAWGWFTSTWRRVWLCWFCSLVDLSDCLIKTEFADTVCISAWIVINRLLFVVAKEFNGRETLDIIWLAYTLMLSHIDSSKFYNTFQMFSGKLIRGSKLFAMSAPWGIELYQPHAVRV